MFGTWYVVALKQDNCTQTTEQHLRVAKLLSVESTELRFSIALLKHSFGVAESFSTLSGSPKISFFHLFFQLALLYKSMIVFSSVTESGCDYLQRCAVNTFRLLKRTSSVRQFASTVSEILVLVRVPLIRVY